MIDKLNELYNGKTIFNFSKGDILFKDSRGTSLREEYNKSDSSLHKTIEQ